VIQPIGVFDSGIGGLTVVRQLMKFLPHEQIIYFGDTARVPYGGKSTETIQKFATQIIDFLLSKNVKLIVIACNTVSATSLEWLKNRYSLPIVGVVDAGARSAVRVTKTNIIGVIGTRATIESKAYVNAIYEIHPGIKVYSKSCPLLVPIVEERSNNKITRLVLNYYLSDLKKKNIDTLILGCTHYPLLKNEIQEIMGEGVKIVDSATTVVFEVRKILKNKNILMKGEKVSHTFYFSDIPRGFKYLSKKFLGQNISYIKIPLEEL
jgi:glutamate racemase